MALSDVVAGDPAVRDLLQATHEVETLQLAMKGLAGQHVVHVVSPG